MISRAPLDLKSNADLGNLDTHRDRSGQKNNAGVVELVDTLDLGSNAERCESSSLSARTFKILNSLISSELRFFYFMNLHIICTVNKKIAVGFSSFPINFLFFSICH